MTSVAFVHYAHDTGRVLLEVDSYRMELEDIKVRGKHCPKPIKTWAQCGVSQKELECLKKSVAVYLLISADYHDCCDCCALLLYVDISPLMSALCISKMWPVATDGVVWSVCLSVCLSVCCSQHS